MNTNKEPSVISTGFKELDNTINGGFNKGEVIILGARPAMGKTSLALNIVQNVCLNMNKGVAVFSLELTKERLIQRMMSLSSEIDNDKFKEGDLNAQDWAKLSNTMKQYINSDVYIDDTVGQSIEEISEKCRELKPKEKNLSLIIIDYLQLINGDENTSRAIQLKEIANKIKELALELEVPILCLSQLSRNIENRDDKRPTLSDIRETLSIVGIADIVLFLYRDEYYYPLKEDNSEEIAEIIVAKNTKSQKVSTVKLLFNKKIGKFTDIQE